MTLFPMQYLSKFSWVVVGASFLCLAAYVSATYILDPAVQDSGGGKASSSSYQLDASIGGPVIAAGVAGGTATSASYGLEVNSMALMEGPAEAPSMGGGGGCAPGGTAAATLWLAILSGALAVRFWRGARTQDDGRPAERC